MTSKIVSLTDDSMVNVTTYLYCFYILIFSLIILSHEFWHFDIFLTFVCLSFVFDDLFCPNNFLGILDNEISSLTYDHSGIKI